MGLLFLGGGGYLWNRHVNGEDDLIPALKYITGIVVLFLAYAAYWLTKEIGTGWEMPASWLQSINPFFIIILAPVFGALWVNLAARDLNPSAPLKFGIGLILLGLGFLVMVFAARVVAGSVPEEVRVSTLFLVMTYLLTYYRRIEFEPGWFEYDYQTGPQALWRSDDGHMVYGCRTR